MLTVIRFDVLLRKGICIVLANEEYVFDVTRQYGDRVTDLFTGDGEIVVKKFLRILPRHEEC